jgi:hypothetical protein
MVLVDLQAGALQDNIYLLAVLNILKFFIMKTVNLT